MDTVQELLGSALFSGIPEDDLRNTLGSAVHSVREYGKGETVRSEGDEAESLGMILKGTVAIQKTLVSGNSITISRLEAGQTFGEAVIFSKKNTYPAAVVSVDGCSVFFLPKKCIMRLFAANPEFLNRYISILSDRIIMLSEIIEELSYGSIKEKIAGFLLREYRKTKDRIFTTGYSRSEMAEKLNIPRPSLSRELSKLRDAGLIDYQKSTFRINDPALLARILK
jgi:CRP/FNR family transcriptional regulator, dissimilatory nitrate respiration regulator